MAQARNWFVEPDPETGEVDPEDLQGALFECAVFLMRAGGATQQMAIRKEDPTRPGVFFTESVVIQWVARTDTQPQPEKAPKADVPEEPVKLEPEPEPVAA